MASVHTDESPPRPGAYLLALPVPTKPILFEQVEERSRRINDGASSVETMVRSVYRDSSGRLRIERSSAGSGVVQVIDPVAWMILVSTDSEKVGYRLPLPKSSPVGFANFALVDGDATASRKWSSKNEQLGTQTIEGVEFEGTRIVQTSDDEPPIIKTLEQWHSTELKLIGLMVVSRPDEIYTIRIRNVRHDEPDPGLFKISAGYKILDLPDR